MDFREAKLQQLDAATTYRVYGHEVDFDQSGASSGGTSRRRWRPILPCFCVQDSPDSPCECMRGEHLWWLLDDAVVGEGKSGHKDKGNDLQFFDVLVDSQIVVESPQPVSVGALKNLGDTIWPRTLGLVLHHNSAKREVGLGPCWRSSSWTPSVTPRTQSSSPLSGPRSQDKQAAPRGRRSCRSLGR